MRGVKKPKKRQILTPIQRSLDSTDLQIMELMHRDGRMSNVSIGRKVHKSPSVVGNRIDALMDAGYIVAFRAVFDWRLMGLPLVVTTQVKLNEHKIARFEKFEAQLEKLEFLQRWQRVQGEFDYWLMFRCRNQAHYGEIYCELIEFEEVALTRTHTPQTTSPTNRLPFPKSEDLDRINQLNKEAEEEKAKGKKKEAQNIRPNPVTLKELGSPS